MKPKPGTWLHETRTAAKIIVYPILALVLGAMIYAIAVA